MPEVPESLDTCSTEKSIVALLHFGWTHEEIATATGVSKGTVQNRRDELEAGDLPPPPEAFSLLRDRERQLHLATRDAAVDTDVMSKQISDLLAAVRELDTLGFGPNADRNYDDLTAYATLVAGQLKDTTPKDAVGKLAKIAERADNLLDPSTTVSERLRQSRNGFNERQSASSEREQPVDRDSAASCLGPNNPYSSSSLNDSNPDAFNRVSDPPINREPANEKEQSLCGGTKQSLFEMDEEECLRRGGNFDSSRRVCHLDESDYKYR